MDPSVIGTPVEADSAEYLALRNTLQRAQEELASIQLALKVLTREASRATIQRSATHREMTITLLGIAETTRLARKLDKRHQ